jgi:hypothetical protein
MNWQIRRLDDIKVGDLVLVSDYPVEVASTQRCNNGCCVLLRWGDRDGEWCAQRAAYQTLSIARDLVTTPAPWMPDHRADER